ncbi:MAG: hypothetical protein IT452_08675 [Planctomycetia bacterium]|nr:hypothetical protein [Planctomycetia bacterium]
MKPAALAILAVSALAAAAEDASWDEEAARVAREEWGPESRHPEVRSVPVPMDASVLAPVRRACRLYRLESVFLTAGGRERVSADLGIVWRGGGTSCPGDDAYAEIVKRAALKADDEGRAAAAALRWTLDAWAQGEPQGFEVESRRLEVDGDVATYRHFSLRFPGGLWLAEAHLVFAGNSLAIVRRPAAIARSVEGEELLDFAERSGPWLQVAGQAPEPMRDRIEAAVERSRTLRKGVAGCVAALDAEDPVDREKAEATLRELGAWALPELRRAAADGAPEVRTRARRLLDAAETGWREAARRAALTAMGDVVPPERRGDAVPFAEIPLPGDILLPLRSRFAVFRASVADQTALGLHVETLLVRRSGGTAALPVDAAGLARDAFLPAGSPEARAARVAWVLATGRHGWRSAYDPARLELRGDAATYHVHEVQTRGRDAVWYEDASFRQDAAGSVSAAGVDRRDLRRDEVAEFVRGLDGWVQVTGDLSEGEWRAVEEARRKGRGPIVHPADRRR